MTNYYRPSGRFQLFSIILVPIVTAIVSMALATPYALAVWFCPLVYLGALLPFVYGILTSLGANRAIALGKVRNPLFAALLALIGALAGYYVTWVAWAVLVVNAGEVVSLGSGSGAIGIAKTWMDPEQFLFFLVNPQVIYELVLEINPEGLWTVKGKAVTGSFLYAVYAIECLFFLGYVVKSAYGRASQPYAEESGKWLVAKKLSSFAALPDEPESIFEKLSVGDLTYIKQSVVEEDPKNNSYLEIILYVGDDGNDPAYITITLKILKKKEHESKIIVNNLQIQRTEALAIGSHYGESF